MRGLRIAFSIIPTVWKVEREGKICSMGRNREQKLLMHLVCRKR
jgi:hypothetical protein